MRREKKRISRFLTRLDNAMERARCFCYFNLYIIVGCLQVTPHSFKEEFFNFKAGLLKRNAVKTPFGYNIIIEDEEEVRLLRKGSGCKQS